MEILRGDEIDPVDFHVATQRAPGHIGGKIDSRTFTSQEGVVSFVIGQLERHPAFQGVSSLRQYERISRAHAVNVCVLQSVLKSSRQEIRNRLTQEYIEPVVPLVVDIPVILEINILTLFPQVQPLIN